jgi:hypothetical protein
MDYFARRILIAFLFLALLSCDKNESEPDTLTDSFFSNVQNRTFRMGFTTWSYGPTLQNVNETYHFIANHGDTYTEHFDNKIPWAAWIEGTSLPDEFVQEVQNRADRKIADLPLVLAVSILNNSREDLAPDYDDNTPFYIGLDDQDIEDAYYSHLVYLIEAFQPTYLIAAIEVNELKMHSPEKWDEFLNLFNAIRLRINETYPLIPISASVSIHNFLGNSGPNTNGVLDFINNQEFAAISYYPYLHNALTPDDFEATFQFLRQNIDVPIAFSETGYIAEDLDLPAFNVFLNGCPKIQNAYLEAILNQAQAQNYLFVTWFAHRDFDILWETFPPEIQDLGKIWRDTGILNEAGQNRISKTSWDIAYSKSFE